MKIKSFIIYVCVPIALINIFVSLVIYSGGDSNVEESGEHKQDKSFVHKSDAMMKAIYESCLNHTLREKSVTDGIECYKLFRGDKAEIDRAERKLAKMNTIALRVPAPLLIEFAQNCEDYKKIRGYSMDQTRSTDQKYPIAFNILIYQDVDQFERLLRALYSPQHQYCIHVDQKASSIVKDAVRAMARCFENVFVAKKSETIVYAGVSRLMADINCMREHLGTGVPWKYLLNFASSELPIRTNEELITILKQFNGTNDIHMTAKYLATDRFKFKHMVWYNQTSHRLTMKKTTERKTPPPFKIKVTKGNAYNIFSREFVEYVLENSLAKRFLHWSRDTYSPDEHFWSSLNNLKDNPHLQTPGGFHGLPDEKPYTAKYIQWKNNGVCGGKFVRSVCVLGVRDLQRLWKSPHIAANKFNLNYDPIAFACLEQVLRNKTIERTPLKHTYYARVHLRADGSKSP